MNCSADGCDKPTLAHKLCRRHYDQIRRASQNRGIRGFIPQHQDTFGCYRAMKARCLYKSNTMYPWYGAKGVKVCERWLVGEGDRTAFQCFVDDMGDRPGPKHSIERKNPNGNYEPSNCRWALPYEQSFNKRNPHEDYGVHYLPKFKVWRAAMVHEGRLVLDEAFVNKADAKAARRAAELKYLGVILQP